MLRFGLLWLDVPVGPFQATSSRRSLQTTAALPATANHENEVSSTRRDGFVPVLSKAAKRRIRAAVKASRDTSHDQHLNARGDVSFDSVHPGFAKAAHATSRESPSGFRRATIDEWPICAKRMGPLKRTPHEQRATSPVHHQLSIRDVTLDFL